MVPSVARTEAVGGTTDGALRAGLRAIPASRIPAFDAAHTRRGRLWFVTFLALSVGGAFEVIAIAPQLVARVEKILAEPDGDVAIERLARWCERGGLDA